MDATTVLRALEDGDLDGAEAATIAAHHAHPHPRVAAVVEWIAQRRTGRDPESLRDEVLDRIDLDDASDAATALAAAARSPLLTGALAELLHDPPFLEPRTAEVESFWDAVAEVVVAVADGRLRQPLEHLQAHARLWCVDADREARADMYELYPLGGWLEKRVGDILAALPAVAPLPAADAAQWSQVALRLAPEARAHQALVDAEAARRRTEATLLDAVYAAPDDDGPRQAYASFLGPTHPRGRFIEAQLRGEATEPGYGEHRWLGLPGSIAHCVRYERGFPASVDLDLDLAPLTEAIVQAPTWRTVRRLHVPSGAPWSEALSTLLASPHLDGLTWMNGLDVAAFVSATRRPRRWTLVGLDIDHAPAEVWPVVHEALERLTALDTLHVRCHTLDDLAALAPVLAFDAPTPLTLVVSIALGAAPWEALQPAVEASGFRRTEVCWGGGGGLPVDREAPSPTARFRLVLEGGRAVLTHHAPRGGVEVGAIVDVVDRLPHLDELTWVHQGEVPPTEGQVEAVRAAVARRGAVGRLPVGRSEDDVFAQHLYDLRHGHPGEVQRAIDALGASSLPEAAQRLVETVLASPDASVRWAAAHAAARRAPPTLAPLLRVALQRTDCESTGVVAHLVGALGDREATPALARLVGSQEATAYTRTNAAEALAWIGDDAATPALTSALEAQLGVDRERPYRRALLDALGMLASREARPLVLRAYEEGDVYDRRSAVTALGRLGDASDRLRLEAHAATDDLYPRGRPALALALLAPQTLTGEVAAGLAACFDGWADSDATFPTLDSLRVLAARELAPEARAALAEAVTAWTRRRRASVRARLHHPTPRAAELRALGRLLEATATAWQVAR